MSTIDILFAFGLVAVAVFVFTRICIKIRKGGGSMFSVFTGATYDLLTQERRKADEIIIEMNAGKKMEEQSSSEDEGDQDEKTNVLEIKNKVRIYEF